MICYRFGQLLFQQPVDALVLGLDLTGNSPIIGAYLHSLQSPKIYWLLQKTGLAIAESQHPPK